MRVFQTMIVGLGRAGAQLHLPALALARAAAPDSGLFDPGPVLAVDPAWPAQRRLPAGVVLETSLEHVRDLIDPARTVVHVCTPPLGRAETVERVAELGFQRLLLEKPLAAGVDEADRIEAAAERYGLRIAVVAQWLSSALTARLAELDRSGRLGALRAIRTVQHKPRFERGLATSGHPTAFDVEAPHALGVALTLAGPAELIDAAGTDMVVDGRILPRMGAARMTLRHASGVRTELTSDLTMPVRERRIELEFERGTAVGHYPVSADDCYAQLSVDEGDGFGAPEVFADEALSVFLTQTYRGFQQADEAARDDDGDAGLRVALATVRLLEQAKQRCAPSAVSAA